VIRDEDLTIAWVNSSGRWNMEWLPAASRVQISVSADRIGPHNASVCVNVTHGIIYTPYWGWYTRIDVNAHPQTVLPHLGCVLF